MNYSILYYEAPPLSLRMFYVLHILSSVSYFIVLENKIRRRDRKLMFLSRAANDRGPRGQKAENRSPPRPRVLLRPGSSGWKEEKSRVRGINCRTNHRRRLVTEQAVSPRLGLAQDGNSRAAGSTHGDCSAIRRIGRIGGGFRSARTHRTRGNVRSRWLVIGVRTLGTWPHDTRPESSEFIVTERFLPLDRYNIIAPRWRKTRYREWLIIFSFLMNGIVKLRKWVV